MKLVSQAVPTAEPAARHSANLRSDPSFHATLVCVERAAEMIRILQRDNESARRQIASLREELRREKSGRHGGTDEIERLIGSWQDKLETAEYEKAQANALAVAAVTRCEELAASEAALLTRLAQAEARTAEAENYLAGLQKAIEFELSGLLG